MTVEQEIQLQASYAYDDGKADGFSQGLSQGLSQGAHEKAVETARILLAKDMASEEISEVTGLSVEEINSFAE